MEQKALYQSRFDALNCCVLIPTYNNQDTLKHVLDGVLSYTQNLIIVNDGSTDATNELLKSYSTVEVLRIPENRGKGNALREGFRLAGSLGYDYAITMDSDGQHYPDDLSVFLEALEQKKAEEPEILVIGSRKMDDPSVPQKSSFGNRCSTFWFGVETGIKLKDTQCGYRLYPLKVVNGLDLYTNKFELEIEVLVKAAWKGVHIYNLPVKVLYDPSERVTHFRPFMDVTRITMLNIWFVAVAYFYIKPRNLLRKWGWFKKKQMDSFSERNLPLE